MELVEDYKVFQLSESNTERVDSINDVVEGDLLVDFSGGEVHEYLLVRSIESMGVFGWWFKERGGDSGGGGRDSSNFGERGNTRRVKNRIVKGVLDFYDKGNRGSYLEERKRLVTERSVEDG